MRGRNGVVLLGVTVILMFLTFLAVAMVVLTRSERGISRNAVHVARARLLARSGIEYARGRLWRGQDPISPSSWTPDNAADDWTFRDGPGTPVGASSNPSWHANHEDFVDSDPAGSTGVFDFTDTDGDGRHAAGESAETFTDRDGNGRFDAFSGRLRGAYGRYGDVFILKVDDANARIDVNAVSPGETYEAYATEAAAIAAEGNEAVYDWWDGLRPTAAILDNLGEIVGAGPVDSAGENALGREMMRARSRSGYGSPEALRRAFPTAFGAIGDYVTTESWRDLQWRVPRGRGEVMLSPPAPAGTSPWLTVDPNGEPTLQWLYQFDFNADRPYPRPEKNFLNPIYFRNIPERRSPIAVNRAPREVLAAVFRGITASFVTDDLHVQYPVWQPFDPVFLGQDYTNPNRNTAIDPDTGGPYEEGRIRITADEADRLADAIVTARDTDPFRTWQQFFEFLVAERDVVFNPSDHPLAIRNLKIDLVYAQANPSTFSSHYNPNVSWGTGDIARRGASDTPSTSPETDDPRVFRQVSKLEITRREPVPEGGDRAGLLYGDDTLTAPRRWAKVGGTTTELTLLPSTVMTIDSLGEVRDGRGVSILARGRAWGAIRLGTPVTYNFAEDLTGNYSKLANGYTTATETGELVVWPEWNHVTYVPYDEEILESDERRVNITQGSLQLLRRPMYPLGKYPTGDQVYGWGYYYAAGPQGTGVHEWLWSSPRNDPEGSRYKIVSVFPVIDTEPNMDAIYRPTLRRYATTALLSGYSNTPFALPDGSLIRGFYNTRYGSAGHGVTFSFWFKPLHHLRDPRAVGLIPLPLTDRGGETVFPNGYPNRALVASGTLDAQEASVTRTAIDWQLFLEIPNYDGTNVPADVSNNRWILYVHESDESFVFTSSQVVHTATDVRRGEWMHAAVVLRGNNVGDGEANLYINGSPGTSVPLWLDWPAMDDGGFWYADEGWERFVLDRGRKGRIFLAPGGSMYATTACFHTPLSGTVQDAEVFVGGRDATWVLDLYNLGRYRMDGVHTYRSRIRDLDAPVRLGRLLWNEFIPVEIDPANPDRKIDVRFTIEYRDPGTTGPWLSSATYDDPTAVNEVETTTGNPIVTDSFRVRIDITDSLGADPNAMLLDTPVVEDFTLIVHPPEGPQAIAYDLVDVPPAAAAVLPPAPGIVIEPGSR